MVVVVVVVVVAEKMYVQHHFSTGEHQHCTEIPQKSFNVNSNMMAALHRIDEQKVMKGQQTFMDMWKK